MSKNNLNKISEIHKGNYALVDPTKAITSVVPNRYHIDTPMMGPPSIYTDHRSGSIAKIVSEYSFDGCEEKETCCSDVVKFFSNSQSYNKLGIPHKRGIILYGPPGTGKSAIALAMQHEAISVGAISFRPRSEREIGAVCELDRRVKKIFIIEQIERFDGDLSLCIDDINENSFVVGTTNEPSSMHERITKRPGRFDRIIKIDRMTPGMLKIMAEKYNMTSYLEKLKEFPVITPAQMAEMSLRLNIYGYSVQESIDSVIKEFYGN